MSAPAFAGHGFGLRPAHYPELIAGGAGADVVEAVTENFIGRGGRPRAVLDRVRQDAALVLHGVSLSIGATAQLDRGYIERVRELCGAVHPLMVSDHLCFGRVTESYGHDLWPLPYTEEALAHVVRRVSAVQDLLRRPLLLENVSSYVTYAESRLCEWDFLSEVARQAGCGILLDVNNAFVSARNHGFSPEAYIDGVAADRVWQIHLAGHLDKGAYLLDDHGSAVDEPVWRLYERAVGRFGRVTTIVEWDENVPTLAVLRAEVAKARAAEARVLGTA